MALLTCPECGAKVSSFAVACMSCGCPIDIIRNSDTLRNVRDAQVGSIIQFGHYHQNEDSKDSTPIDWRVLEVRGRKALLISEKALDCQRYNDFCTNITWETCSLRKWMNRAFLHTAFSRAEQAAIQSTRVSAGKNPMYKTKGGNATMDKVFLLSISEVEKYFTSDSARMCNPTEHAVVNGAWTSNNGNCWWWLRSSTSFSSGGAYVNADGSVDYSERIDYGRKPLCVRPALWLNLDRILLEPMHEQHPDKQKPSALYRNTPKVGSVIQFGHYHQNAHGQDSTPIDWRVLEVCDRKALLISEKALDCQRYNNSLDDVKWENCSLRKWMNEIFLDEAFSAEEQAMIQSTTVTADKNPRYSTDPGNATTDKVFLLSITEVEKYFESNCARQCTPTVYAIVNEAFVDNLHGNCWWFLRSPGESDATTVVVDDDGSVYYRGCLDFGGKLLCVRPALWIDLDRILLEPMHEQNPDKQKPSTLYRNTPKVGSVIQFGHYHQNEDGKDSTPIDWRVLDVCDRKILLISEKALDCQRYNESLTKLTWKNCSLRKWINEIFLDEAFSAEEQAMIQSTTISTFNQKEINVIPETTSDKVFLLSVSEVKMLYLPDFEYAKCTPTAYAKSRIAFTSDFDKESRHWWLRSTDNNEMCAAYVSNDGWAIGNGKRVDDDSVCVRPALWVNLDC